MWLLDLPSLVPLSPRRACCAFSCPTLSRPYRPPILLRSPPETETIPPCDATTTIDVYVPSTASTLRDTTLRTAQHQKLGIMDDYGGDAGAPATTEGVKRKRSNSPDRLSTMHAPPAKLSKTLPGAHVDFLATPPAEEPLQLVDIDDSLRFIQQHLEQYSRAVEHHESLAANMGVKLQAPNTVRRFERLFVHPIKILANHGKEGNHVTWLDIVRFHEDKPNQMKLHPKDGDMVCQFYTKQ